MFQPSLFDCQDDDDEFNIIEDEDVPQLESMFLDPWKSHVVAVVTTEMTLFLDHIHQGSVMIGIDDVCFYFKWKDYFAFPWNDVIDVTLKFTDQDLLVFTLPKGKSFQLGGGIRK
jgi:hypothetical protein